MTGIATATRVLCMAVLAATGSTLPAQQTSTTPGAMIRGTVVAADTGLPITDAAVALEPVVAINSSG